MKMQAVARGTYFANMVDGIMIAFPQLTRKQAIYRINQLVNDKKARWIFKGCCIARMTFYEREETHNWHRGIFTKWLRGGGPSIMVTIC
jgi:hypothetical protein